MKRIVNLLIFMLLAVSAMAQQKPPQEQTHTGQILSNWATWAKQYELPPTGATPSIPAYVPDSLKDGALWNITGSSGGLYRYNKNLAAWQRIGGDTTSLSARIDRKINTSLINANNGVAPLDAGGKVPFTNLPASLMIYKGVWNAITNTPALSDASGTTGWVYKASTPGVDSVIVNLGVGGNRTFYNGDYAIYNGTIWQKSGQTEAVVSVSINGLPPQQGIVNYTLTTDNISEGSNKYYTDARSRAALSASSPLNYNSSTGVVSLTGIVPYANGGTNANTAFTAGSVLFAGASAISQNNSNLFWDNTNQFLGIGTNTPTSHLHVKFSVAGGSNMNFENPSTSSAAWAGVELTASGGSTFIYQTSATYAATTPNSTIIQNHAFGDIIFITDNGNPAMTLTGSRGAGNATLLLGASASYNAASIFTATSTTKGSSPIPVLTIAQWNAISSKPAGLMGYTAGTNKYHYFDGTVDRALLDSARANSLYAPISVVGTMTSLTPGYGFTSSTPITGAGTLNIDSSKIATQWALAHYLKASKITDGLTYTDSLRLGGDLTGDTYITAQSHSLVLDATNTSNGVDLIVNTGGITLGDVTTSTGASTSLSLGSDNISLSYNGSTGSQAAVTAQESGLFLNRTAALSGRQQGISLLDTAILVQDDSKQGLVYYDDYHSDSPGWLTSKKYVDSTSSNNSKVLFWGAVGSGVTSDIMGPMGVTMPADGNSYAYLGLTRASATAVAFGLDNLNALIIGHGSGRGNGATIDTVLFRMNTNNGDIQSQGSIQANSFITSGALPSVTLGSGATGTVSISGNNQDGTVTLTGASSLGGDLLKVTMSGGFAYGTACTPTLTAVTGTGAAGIFYSVASTTTTWTLSTQASLGSGTYSWMYHNGGN